MKNRIAAILVTAMLCPVMISGCGQKVSQNGQAALNAAEESAVKAEEEAAASEAVSEQTEADTSSDTADTSKDSDTASKVADKSEMTEIEEVVEEGMVPVTGDQIKDGVYPVSVSSSSSMFRIESAQLSVQDGSMSAVMTMGGTGYLYLYMGTGEEAAAASEEDFIPYEETEEGTHTFTIPVEALDRGIACAAFSKKKEKWYDRTILFRADSLPADAFADGYLTTLEDLDLADGSYTVEASLQGGSGRASIDSPASLTISDGNGTLTAAWSSPNYDYMIVNGEKYLPVNTEGNSVFEIPWSVFDVPVTVLADTTAMSQPHEIEYKIRLDSSTLRKAE